MTGRGMKGGASASPTWEFRKNASEIVRVSLGRFREHDLANIRVFYDAGGGELRPGKAGLAIRVQQLPELLEALRNAEAEAVRLGLLERGTA